MRRITVGLMATAVFVGLFSAPVTAQQDSPDFVFDPSESDIIVPPRPLNEAAFGHLNDYDDPLGLVRAGTVMTRHTIGTDTFEVWLCDVDPVGGLPFTVADAVSDLNGSVAGYWDAWSNGVYDVTFTAGGVYAAANDDACSSFNSASGTTEGIIRIRPGAWGGFGGPGAQCLPGPGCPASYPDNGRSADIDSLAFEPVGLFPETEAIVNHEIGHTLDMPHSFTGGDPMLGEYDNPIDLMSGNRNLLGGTADVPYGTIAFNRYAAGWIDPDDVELHPGGPWEYVLEPITESGTQMLVIGGYGTQGHFYAVGARLSSPLDPIPVEFEGVEVYEIDQTCADCVGINRSQMTVGGSPGTTDHVLEVGDSVSFGSFTIEVLAAGESFRVRVTGGTIQPIFPHLGRFKDDDKNTHEKNIEAIAEDGVTLGCGGPFYCPGEDVTRGQMASFLARAFDLPASPTDFFEDDDGTTHEDNINRIANAGITLGFPDGTYQPLGLVSREQMGSFIARAMGLAPIPGDVFLDVSGTHEGNINAIANAGVTLGCNPEGTLYCPFENVRRDQMASFLARAIPLAPIPAIPPFNPGDNADCGDFAVWADAQAWHDFYKPYFGDVAMLDADDDGVVCESLPGAP